MSGLVVRPSRLHGAGEFQFAGGSNIDSSKAMHVHEGSTRLLGEDRIEWKWGGYQDGKPADGHKVAMTLVRKK
jgi:hypothetical protein